MTPGPWALRGRQIRAEGGLGKHVADYMVDAEDGETIAAAPELEMRLRALLVVLGKLDEDALNCVREEASEAWDVLSYLDGQRERARIFGGQR